MIEIWRSEPERGRSSARSLRRARHRRRLRRRDARRVRALRLGLGGDAILLAEFLPGMFAGPLIGAWLDRQDRLRCVIAADIVRAASLVAMIVLPGAPALFALALVTGIATTVFRPAAFALLPSVVHADRRMAATAPWGAVHDAGTMIGPALAAGALVLGGASALLGATAALFAGSALLFARVKLASAPSATRRRRLARRRHPRGSALRQPRPRLRVLVAGTGVIVLGGGHDERRRGPARPARPERRRHGIRADGRGVRRRRGCSAR